MSTDATPVASSPTTESVTPAPSSVPEGLSESSRALSRGDFAAFRQSRRTERAADAGVTLPTPSGTTAPEPQAPTEPAEPAPQATADQPDPTPEKPKHKGADERIKELLRQRYEEREARLRMEGELEALRRQLSGQPTPETKPAASSPARVMDRPAPQDDPEPRLEDFEADPAKYPDPYTAYVRAVGRWEARQEFNARQQAEQQRVQRERAQAAIAETVQRYQSSVDAEFMATLRPEVTNLVPSFMPDSQHQPPALTAIADEALRSSDPRAFLTYLNDHPDELQQMARMLPVQLFKALGRIEASLTAKPAPVAPATTAAPPPPTTLGTRPADPGSPVDAAMNRGDFAAYRDAKKRERIASAGLR